MYSRNVHRRVYPQNAHREVHTTPTGTHVHVDTHMCKHMHTHVLMEEALEKLV